MLMRAASPSADSNISRRWLTDLLRPARRFMVQLANLSVANYQLRHKCVGFEVPILLPGCATY